MQILSGFEQVSLHSIPNDNHSALPKRTQFNNDLQNHTETLQTFLTGDYSAFFIEYFLSNKDLSEEIMGQSLRGEHC